MSRKRNPICGFKTTRFIICEDIINITQIEAQLRNLFSGFKTGRFIICEDIIDITQIEEQIRNPICGFNKNDNIHENEVQDIR